MRGALNKPEQLEKVLAHELTHALVRSLAPKGAPTWIDEGLAVIYEKGDLHWAEHVISKASSLIPLSDLHHGFLRLPEDQIRLAYAESALAVRMLLERSGPLTLAMLLKDVDAGQEFAAAFERRFSFTYSDFQKSCEEDLRTFFK
jgi:hypothetical protein